MKKVLIPTDFSANAWKAAQYAAFLAQGRNWHLHICHVYQPFYSGFQSDRQNKKDKAHAKEESCKRMNTIVRRLQQLFPQTTVEGSCVTGNVKDTILEKSEQTNAILIVMGTEGTGGARYPLFGSITYGVIQKTTVPVMAVPKDTRREPLTRVGFTTNFHAVEITTLHDFVELVGKDTEVVPFHLYTTDKKTEEAKMKAWQEKAGKMIPNRTLRFKLARIKSHTAGMRHVIETENLQAIAMTQFEKDFFTRIIGRDLIKAVVHQCSVPIIFFPRS